MLYVFIFFATAFTAVEFYLFAVEGRRCSKCEYCYSKKGVNHCIRHDTPTYMFPEEYRKWGEWNIRTQTCTCYKRRRKR